MGSEANDNEMKIMIQQQKTMISQEEKRYEEMKQKLEEDTLVLTWYEGFWAGFTTGAFIVTVLYGVLR